MSNWTTIFRILCNLPCIISFSKFSSSIQQSSRPSNWFVSLKKLNDFSIYLNSSSCKVFFLSKALKLIFYFTRKRLYLCKVNIIIKWRAFFSQFCTSVSVRGHEFNFSSKESFILAIKFSAVPLFPFKVLRLKIKNFRNLIITA